MNEPLFCECCGQSLEELRKEIEENGIPTIEGGKHLQYGKHILCQKGEIYSNDISINYCSECGANLEYEDYKLIYESYPWGSTTATKTLIGGYRCHACGFKTEV